MTSPVHRVRPDDDVADADAARHLLAWRISALPVVEHRRRVGIIATTDCRRALVRRDAATAWAGRAVGRIGRLGTQRRGVAMCVRMWLRWSDVPA